MKFFDRMLKKGIFVKFRIGKVTNPASIKRTDAIKDLTTKADKNFESKLDKIFGIDRGDKDAGNRKM